MAYNKNCDPLSKNFDVPVLPPIPGLDGFTVDINFPTLGLDLPEGIPEDLLEWIRRLKFTLPGGGKLESILRTLQDTIASIIARLLQSLNLFLSVYNFILALIEIIICIINVLTAFKNIRKMIKRIKCLIRKCFPLFVRIALPFFVLLALLLDILAILLALIEYIIELIKRLIEQIVRNVKRLSSVLRDGNSEAALAVISKISDLMCLFEHIFVLLSIIDLIITLIKGKINKKFIACKGDEDENNNSILNTDDLCASFLKEPNTQVSDNPETWELRMNGGTSSTVWYCNEVYGQPYLLSPTISTKIRSESVYLKDDTLADALKFKNIIKYKPLNENRYFPMFPFDKTITKDIDSDMIPYFVDIKISANPNDGNGKREILVKDTVVTLPTYTAFLDVIASVPIKTTNYDGYLMLSGGETEDGYGYDGFTIERLLADVTGIDPTTNGVGSQQELSLVSYQVKANYETLVEYGLITIGCLPSMQQEYAHFDEVYEKPTSTLTVDLPDVNSSIGKLRTCISTFSSAINENTISTFNTCMNTILADLSDSAMKSYGQLLNQSIDLYNISISVDPDLQFVNYPIELKAYPLTENDKTFDELVGGFSSSVDIDDYVSKNFTAKVNLGTVSEFTYDGYGAFVAEITSDVPGDGYAEVYYKGEQIPTVISPTDLDEQPSVVYNPIEYTFVGYFADNADGILPGSRRDEGDVSRD